MFFSQENNDSTLEATHYESLRDADDDDAKHEAMEVEKPAATVASHSAPTSPRRSPRIKGQPAHCYAEDWPSAPLQFGASIRTRTPTKADSIRSPRRRHEATLGGDMQNVLEQTENLKIADDDGDRLRAARRLLWHDETPSEFVHREAEIRKIAAFIANFVGDGDMIARTLFLAGVPGTGKTSCVLKVKAKPSIIFNAAAAERDALGGQGFVRATRAAQRF